METGAIHRHRGPRGSRKCRRGRLQGPGDTRTDAPGRQLETGVREGHGLSSQKRPYAPSPAFRVLRARGRRQWGPLPLPSSGRPVIGRNCPNMPVLEAVSETAGQATRTQREDFWWELLSKGENTAVILEHIHSFYSLGNLESIKHIKLRQMIPDYASFQTADVIETSMLF